jgi:hypothetical protein
LRTAASLQSLAARAAAEAASLKHHLKRVDDEFAPLPVTERERVGERMQADQKSLELQVATLEARVALVHRLLAQLAALQRTEAAAAARIRAGGALAPLGPLALNLRQQFRLLSACNDMVLSGASAAGTGLTLTAASRAAPQPGVQSRAQPVSPSQAPSHAESRSLHTDLVALDNLVLGRMPGSGLPVAWPRSDACAVALLRFFENPEDFPVALEAGRLARSCDVGHVLPAAAGCVAVIRDTHEVGWCWLLWPSGELSGLRRAGNPDGGRLRLQMRDVERPDGTRIQVPSPVVAAAASGTTHADMASTEPLSADWRAYWRPDPDHNNGSGANILALVLRGHALHSTACAGPVLRTLDLIGWSLEWDYAAAPTVATLAVIATGGLFLVAANGVAHVTPADTSASPFRIGDMNLGHEPVFFTVAAGVTSDSGLVVLSGATQGVRTDAGHVGVHSLTLVWFAAAPRTAHPGGVEEAGRVLLPLLGDDAAMLTDWRYCRTRVAPMPDGTVLVYLTLPGLRHRLQRRLVVFTASRRGDTCDVTVRSTSCPAAAGEDEPLTPVHRVHFEIVPQVTGSLLASWCSQYVDVLDNCVRRLC